jgi:type VI secretion system secreted protein VgrG
MAEVKVFILASLDVEGIPFRVLRYDLREALSELSTLRCEVTEQDQLPRNPSELSGKTASFTLSRTDGNQERKFLGRVVSAERSPDTDDVRTLKLDIAPAPWALSKRADCRVYQEQSVVDIAKDVLEKAGVTSDMQDWKLTGQHPEREYITQYRERDLTFLRRILGEEGIYFALDHTGETEKIVFGDDTSGLGDIKGTTALPFHHAQGADEVLDWVMRVKQTLSVTPDKVTLRDYNFDQPKLDLTSEVESEDEGEHALEVYDYPGRFGETGEGDERAQVLLDSMQAGRHTVSGESGALTLLPAYRFSIENHPYAPINQEYLLTSIHIEGGEPRLGAAGGTTGGDSPRYRCRFEAVPNSTSYRPPRRPQAAQIVGLHTAFTTGPSGEEIHTNDKGQAKIRYHWDRLGPKDDGSSLWVRSNQLAIGDSMLLPRMAWEVSLDHLEGDPDRPMVMGRMYNAVTPPPYKLPEEAGKSSLQTATTPGGGSSNEFRFSDNKGSECMFFNASYDMSVDVKNNTTSSIGNNCARTIGSNQVKNVTNSSTQSVAGNQSITVGGDQGLKVETLLQDEVGADHSLSIGGNRDMKIGGDHKREVGGNSKLDVGAMNTDLVVGSVTEDILGDLTHTAGTAIVELTVANRSLTVGGSATETAGAAKVIVVGGGRGLEVGGTMTQKVAGAIVNIAKGDRKESSGGTYSEVAAGAHVVKADNITIEAKSLISLVMGASTLIVSPAAVAIAGVKIKLDGDVSDLGALVVDN